MKKKKALTALSAALIGISVPSSALLSNNFISLTAHAGSGTTSDGLVYVTDDKTKEVTIRAYRGKSKEVVVPSTIDGMPVTVIDFFSFQDTNITSIVLPETLKLIQQRAFLGCDTLQSLTINGPTEISAKAFSDCTALTSVTISDEAYTNSDIGFEAFKNCPNLYTVNGVNAIAHETDENGIEYPVLDPAVTEAVRNNFCRSINVGFVNDYCTELCEYIVATETDPWMSDAIKARQLHDWLIYHCEYEDRANGEATYDNENHVASSVFLSYAVNERGEGIGETVCDGFSKAYTMLLAAADIESYYVGHSLHAWNVVKIDGNYYTVDITNDNSSYNNLKNKSPYSTYYGNFLGGYEDSDAKQSNFSEHPLLQKYTNNINGYLMSLSSYKANSSTGIIDYDYDLDGIGIQYDFYDDLNAYNGFLQFAYASDMESVNKRLDEVLYNLHQYHQSFWEFLNTNGPKSQTVSASSQAKFSVAFFGDNISYQWQYCNAGSNKWTNLTSASAKTPTLTETASASKNGMKYRCIVTNKNGQSAVSSEAVLTVK